MAAAAFPMGGGSHVMKATGRGFLFCFWLLFVCFVLFSSLGQVGALGSGVNGVCTSLPYEASSKQVQPPPALGAMSKDAASPPLYTGSVLDRLILYTVFISSTARTIKGSTLAQVALVV